MQSRLIVHSAAPGDWNMAVDEALFVSALDGSPPVVRLYQWSEPTLSLGYFQNASERDSHPPSLTCPLVRRSTGGGAIVHDRELTYSLVMSLEDESPAAARALMTGVHQSLVKTLGDLGIQAYACTESNTHSTAEKPFLCFLRHTPGDLLIAGHKVTGSAQRRHRRIVLQHGSILLERSAAAPELAGIAELAGSGCSAEVLIERWPNELERIFTTRFTSSELQDSERELARQILADRFASDRWNLKR